MARVLTAKITDVIWHILGRSADEFVCCLGDRRHGYVVATSTLAAVWRGMLVSECNIERLHWNVEATD